MMKVNFLPFPGRKHLLLLVFGLGVACQNRNTDSLSSSQEATVELLEQRQCNCSQERLVTYARTGPEFTKYERIVEGKNLNTSQWEAYTHDSVRLKVKTISFVGFDSIPEKFSVFQNVEVVILSGGLHGLDMFPRLNALKVFGGIKIDTSRRWLKRVQFLTVEKSEISGLKSFRSLPNLIELKMAFSAFDKFPSDIERLKCLREVEFGAPLAHSIIDLRKIDLRKFNCLKKAVFVSWHNNLIGIPLGLGDSTVTTDVEIYYPSLKKTRPDLVRNYFRRNTTK